MSRLYSSQYHNNNSNNNDVLINNCETFLSKMMKAKRADRPRTEMRSCRDKSIGRTNNQIAVPRPVVKPGMQIVKVEEPRRKPSALDVIHKEVFNNNIAGVEVTVRTVAPKSSDNKAIVEEAREPWGKLLTATKSDENIQGTFGHFDPLRTLHFLSKELQMKLQNLCPSDVNVQQIVNDMQNTMQRLPPDILTQMQSTAAFQNSSNGDCDYLPKKSIYQVERKLSKHVQTVIIGDVETKKMQQQLEDSASKLEASCKEMENVCTKLRKERDEFETKLFKEQETVASLRKELAECISEKEEKLSREVEQLRKERDGLQSEVKELKSEFDVRVGQSVDELRSLVEELRTKQLNAEQENSAKRNELTMIKLERDKMNVLLECRDKQLRELRNELECIQQLVTSQLTELKIKPTLSNATSVMSSTSQLWNVPSSVRSQKLGKSVHELFLNSDVMRKMLMNKEMQIVESGTETTLNGDEHDMQEIPQRDHPNTNRLQSEMTISEATMSTATDNGFLRKLSSPSIKDMFAEIKRQAFKKLDLPMPLSARPTNETQPPDSRASLSS